MPVFGRAREKDAKTCQNLSYLYINQFHASLLSTDEECIDFLTLIVSIRAKRMKSQLLIFS